MPEMVDVFTPDAFNVHTMTAAINSAPFVPGRIGQMGIFEESGIPTLTAVIESQNGTLGLLSPTPRGGPGQTTDKEKRTIRSFVVPHFQHDDAIMADEVQGVREFGTTGQLRTVQNFMNQRIASRVPYFDATLEFQRVGAVKGVITYADSSTLDLFAEFGVSQIGEIDFDLDNANPASGVLRKKCATVTRAVADELGALPYTGLRAICGDAFFDDLLAHKEVVDSYKNTPMAQVLREGYLRPNGQKVYGAFEFGDIVWENYRGSVGGTAFVDANKCHIFPEGVPGLFKTWFAPADYWETVNTIGLPRYAKPIMMPNGKGMSLEMQSNPLSICTRPRTLIKGKRT